MNRTRNQVLFRLPLPLLVVCLGLFSCGDLNVGSGGGDFFAPSVNTDEIVKIGADFVTVAGEVTYDGEDDVTERGFLLSFQNEPTEDNGTKIIEGEGEGDFESTITNLEMNTTYYVRAYAENNVGRGFGEELEFTTDEIAQNQPPIVRTVKIDQLASRSARAEGEVVSNGGAEITNRGFVWDNSPNPSISSSMQVQAEQGAGIFNTYIGGLKPSSTYYIKAYATNEVGTAYGEELSFTTLDDVGLPSLLTREIMLITTESATSGGQITDDGGSEITDKGVVFDTSPQPNIENARLSSSGAGSDSFESSMLNLDAETKYYVRAYATNGAGTAYGDELSFTTLPEDLGTLPTVETADVIAITDTSAICGGNVTNDGNLQVTARGVVWSLNPQPEVGSGNSTTDGAGRGSFVSVIAGLFPSTQYYIRAYATNSEGTAYGPQLTFTTKNN